jgi:hypothetical protein
MPLSPLASSPDPSATVRRGTQAVGTFFAACAMGNAVGTLPHARSFLEWCRDGAWLPSHRAVLTRLVPVAPWVVGATAVFESGVAALLLGPRRHRLGLRLATAWVLGISPAIAWPYWLANVPQAALYAALARRADS